MSETTPPIPKSGGSGPFVLAAIIMLLLMGGLIFWKMKGGSETPKAQETPPPSATQNTPTLDEAPPPPPPVASDSAAPTPSSTTAKKVTSGGGNGGPCGVCSGEPNPGLNGALSAKAAQSRSCYEHALRQNSMLAGRMRIHLKINQQGQVCSSDVPVNELGDPSVVNCIVGLFRGASFPAPSGGCVEANVPLNFTPKT